MSLIMSSLGSWCSALTDSAITLSLTLSSSITAAQNASSVGEAVVALLPLLALVVTLFTSVAAVALAWIIWDWSAPRMNVPTFGAWYPFLGNYLALRARLPDVLEVLKEGEDKFKRTWALTAPSPKGGRVIMVINSPENVEYVLKTNFDNYVKGELFIEKFRELLGNGIFNSDGEEWRVQRKTASHLFTMKELKGFMSSVFVEHGHKVLKKLEEAADKPDTYVDVQDLYFQFTFDSICEIAFGLKVGTLCQPIAESTFTKETVNTPIMAYLATEGTAKEKEAIMSKTREASSLPPIDLETADEQELAKYGAVFANSFDILQSLVEKRFYIPHWELLRSLQTREERLITENVKVLDNFAYQIIARRRQAAAESLKSRQDLLSMFLQKRPSGEGDGEDENYSDKYLRDVILNFIIAGRDTTAQALSWSTHLLMQHPDALRTFRKEIDQVIPLERGVRDFSQCHRLRYGEAIVSEALRLYPSVPKDTKVSVKEDVLPDGTHVKPGWMLAFSPYVMGRLESIWPNATSFKPERWLETQEKSKGTDAEALGTTQLDVSAFKYPVFNAGPRTCLGKHVALLEARILLSMVFDRFELIPAPGHRVIHYDSTTMPMKYGLKVQVKRRVLG